MTGAEPALQWTSDSATMRSAKESATSRLAAITCPRSRFPVNLPLRGRLKPDQRMIRKPPSGPADASRPVSCKEKYGVLSDARTAALNHPIVQKSKGVILSEASESVARALARNNQSRRESNGPAFRLPPGRQTSPKPVWWYQFRPFRTSGPGRVTCPADNTKERTSRRSGPFDRRPL